MQIERSLCRVLGGLISNEWLASFADCLKDRMLVDPVRPFDGDVQMVSGKSRFKSIGFCFGVDDSGWALNVLRVWRTEECVLCEQRIYAGQEFEAQKKQLNSFMLTSMKKDGKKELWAGKAQLLSRCFMKDESKSEEFSFLQFEECVLSLAEADRALRFVCQKWATASLADKGPDVEEEKKDGDATAVGEGLNLELFYSRVV